MIPTKPPSYGKPRSFMYIKNGPFRTYIPISNEDMDFPDWFHTIMYYVAIVAGILLAIVIVALMNDTVRRFIWKLLP